MVHFSAIRAISHTSRVNEQNQFGGPSEEWRCRTRITLSGLFAYMLKSQPEYFAVPGLFKSGVATIPRPSYTQLTGASMPQKPIDPTDENTSPAEDTDSGSTGTTEIVETADASNVARPPRPVSAVKLDVSNIPAELKKLNRWILWKYSWVRTKWTKTPHSAKGGFKIDATNFDNGVDFVTAVQALKHAGRQFDGLGFMLGAGIAGIDVDDCIDSEGNLDERGQRMSKAYMASYAEVSPSGHGFKVLVDIGSDPKLAAIGKSTPELEIYGGRRYFTVTGAKLLGHPKLIAPMAQAFTETAASIGVQPRTQLAPLYFNRQQEILGWTIEQAYALLDALPWAYCDDYHTWIRGGMALHHEFNGSEEAREIWEEYSSRNGDPKKYQMNCTMEHWPTFGTKPGKANVTLRSLIKEARASGNWAIPPNIEQAMHEFSALDDDGITEEPIVNEEGEIQNPDAIRTWWEKRQALFMLVQRPKPIEWVWPGVLRQGKLMLLAGSGGSSKSYIMLCTAVQYTLSNEWGPFKFSGHEPGRVLLVYGEEDEDDVHQRMYVLKEHFMLNDAQVQTVGAKLGQLALRGHRINFASSGLNGFEKGADLVKLEKRIVENKIRLVVIDPLAMFHSLDENDNVAIASLVRELDGVCDRTGCAMIIVHHFGKGGTLEAREINEHNVRGASALVAHARTVAVTHKLRRTEAASWGITEEDAARWVLFAIPKNNYGATGLQYWFEISAATGALTPSQTQLQYQNPMDIRAAARAHTNEEMDNDRVQRDALRAQAEAVQQLEHFSLVEFYLTHAIESNGGSVVSARAAPSIAKAAGRNCNPNQATKAVRWIYDQNLIDPVDRFVNDAGRTWLDNRDF